LPHGQFSINPNTALTALDGRNLMFAFFFKDGIGGDVIRPF